MVERVAAALDRYYVGLWREQRGVRWLVRDRADRDAVAFNVQTQAEARDFCRTANARAVIEAMREPTEAMVDAAARALWESDRHDWVSPDYSQHESYLRSMAKTCGHAMIDAALSEEGRSFGGSDGKQANQCDASNVAGGDHR